MLPLRIPCAMLLLAVLGVAQNTTGDNTANQTDEADPVLEALTAEAARKKKEAEIAESEKKIRDAQPAAGVKVLEGKTTIDDNVTFESEMFSYKAVQEISKQIASQVNNRVPTKGAIIFIHDAALQSALRAYQALQVQEQAFQHRLQLLLDNLKNLDQPTTMKNAPFPIVAGAVRSVIDLLSLFRQDTDFKGRSFTVNEEALVAQVANEINKLNGNVTVVYPKLWPPGLLMVPSAENSKLIKVIEKLNDIQVTATGHGRQLEREIEERAGKTMQINKRIKTFQKDLEGKKAKLQTGDTIIEEASDKLDGEKEKLKRVMKEIESRENLKQDFANLNSQAASSLETLLKTEQATGNPLLATLLTAENVIEQLNCKKGAGFILTLKTVAAGGSYRIRRNLFTTLFTGALLSYSGGAIVSFIMFDADSKIVESRTLQYMNSFSKFRK